MLLGHDLRHSVRALRRSPWYAATVVAVISLSIAMMTAVFAVVDGVLFRPLPYPDSEDVFAVGGVFEGDQEPLERLVGMISPRELNAWRSSVPDVPITLLGYSSVTLEDGSFALAATVDRQFFDVFGVRLLVGGFAEADVAGPVPVRPILISHALWQSHFNGDPDIVGRIFTPHGFRSVPHRIAGVLDRDGFVPPLPGRPGSWVRQRSRIDALFPNTLAPGFGERIGVAFARVPAARAAAVESVLDAAVIAYRSTVPPPRRPFTSVAQRRGMGAYDGASFVPIAEFATARQRPILAIVFATAVGLALLVMLNAGALATARAQQRLREMALRRSLGARTRDLLRTALVEQSLLTAAGAALGLLLAPSLLRLIARELPAGLELIKEVRVDWRAASVVAMVAAAMAAGVAVLSARFAVRHAALNPLLAMGPGGGRAGARVARVLVAGQIALAFGLVLGGALFLRSLGLVWSEDTGLRTRDAALLRVSFAERADPSRQLQLLETVRGVPGVAAAGAVDRSILENFDGSSSVFRGPDGGPPPAPVPLVARVTSGFFDAAGIRLIAGRLPTDAELDAGAPVIAVSETLADRYWPDEDPIGRSLRSGRLESRVVGVVRDARLVAVDAAPTGTIFAGLDRDAAFMRLFVAFRGQADLVLTRLVAQVPEADPLARVIEAKMIDEIAAESVRPRTLSAIAASGFALGALVLTAIGLFGLAAQTTGRRTREMGIRLALGDTPAGLIRLVARGQAATLLGGLAAGALLAAALVRLISSYLYGVTAYDATTWMLAASVVSVAAAVGTLVPALRASGVSPVEALRAE
ncbi:MAG: ABC transporter permease [Vicinamibacterales bacterium]